jgi:hypothetical protein
VLDHVTRLLAAAERSADRIADLCRRGESVDNAVAELSAAVAAVAAGCPNGIPPELHRRWLSLSERVAAATRAAEARTNDLAAELEHTARHDRVRRAYLRPAG